MRDRKAYTTDLTDEQWLHLRVLLPRVQGKGQRHHPQQQRELLNAMFYVVHTGCQWRELPHDFPPWQTVYGYFRALCEAGVWETINSHLRRGIREQADRASEPSEVIVDSQSVKTTEKRGSAADLTVATGSKDENGISRSM